MKGTAVFFEIAPTFSNLRIIRWRIQNSIPDTDNYLIPPAFSIFFLIRTLVIKYKTLQYFCQHSLREFHRLLLFTVAYITSGYSKEFFQKQQNLNFDGCRQNFAVRGNPEMCDIFNLECVEYSVVLIL